jgi:hypothetical protein
LDEGACFAVKNIGKPCAGKPHARFDEGRLMDDRLGGHVVAACGEASMKSHGHRFDISFLLYPYATKANGRLDPLRD